MTATEIHDSIGTDAEAAIRERAKADGLSPILIELVVQLVLQYGPLFYDAILKWFHVIPRPTPVPVPTPGPTPPVA